MAPVGQLRSCAKTSPRRNGMQTSDDSNPGRCPRLSCCAPFALQTPQGEIQEPRATPWEAGPYPSSPNRGEMVLAITNRVTRYARHAFRKHDVKCDDDISSSDSGLEDVISPHSGLDHKCARFPGRCPGLFYGTPSGLRDARLARILVARGKSQNRSHREMIGRDAAVPLSAIDARVDH